MWRLPQLKILQYWMQSKKQQGADWRRIIVKRFIYQGEVVIRDESGGLENDA
jgi:hypothetical protein